LVNLTLRGSPLLLLLLHGDDTHASCHEASLSLPPGMLTCVSGRAVRVVDNKGTVQVTRAEEDTQLISSNKGLSVTRNPCVRVHVRLQADLTDISMVEFLFLAPEHPLPQHAHQLGEQATDRESPYCKA
jgi:hypothetical protein